MDRAAFKVKWGEFLSIHLSTKQVDDYLNEMYKDAHLGRCEDELCGRIWEDEDEQ